MSELSLAMRLQLKNELTRPLKAALGEVQASSKALELALKGVDRAANDTARSVASIGRGDPLRGINSDLMTMRGLLREIASGAGRAMRELGRRNMGTVRGGLRGANMAFQGVQAGSLALKYQMQKPIDYELRLAHLANTAYADRDTAGRKAGALDMNSAIMGAVRTGRGSRDQAVEALDTLIASGALSIDESKALLPSLVKGATASGSDANALAQIAIRAKQSFGISGAQLPQLLDMALTAGQAGGFELKDMAKWLPQQMAAGRMSGMKGTGDFARLLALNQLTVTTAGSKDEAGNNLVNLLAKINSQDTANDAKKLGIDLSGTLSKARSQGIDPVTAFTALVKGEALKDKQYVALRDQASRAGTPEEKQATYGAMADILQGKAVGKLIQDRQALMALVAIMNNGDQLGGLMDRINGGGGAIDKNFAVIGDTYASKSQGLASEQEFAKTALFGPLAGPMGALAEQTTALYQKYPALGEAMEGLKIAANAATAALAAAGITGLVTSGGGAAAALGAAGVAGTAGRFAMMAGGAGLAGAAGYGAGTLAYNSGLGDWIGKYADKIGSTDSNMAKAGFTITNKIMLDGRQIAESNNRVAEMNNRRN
jgi:hypothetical protein